MSISNKERASKHATRSRECADCGKKVRGNVKWRDAVENDKLLHAAAGAPPASELPAVERGDVDDEAGVEPALEAPSDVVRLDYSVPPPGYTADGQWWSYPAPPKPRRARDIGPPGAA